MSLSIDEQVTELGDTITQARWHFDVWMAIQETRADPKSVDVMNKYLEFFSASTLALFESYIVGCYQMLETKHDRVSFPSLKHELLAVEGQDIDTDPALVEIQKKMKPLWIKIGTLRNRSVGHTSKMASQATVFKAAGLSPNQVQEFLDLAKKLHQDITHRRSGREKAFNIEGKTATKRLFQDLVKLL